jgi:flagellar hook assembly protein FlgD
MNTQITDKTYKEIPDKFSLFQNYPNPFNPRTEITFTLAEESEVSMVIYNIRGQVVKKLVNEKLNSGKHTVVWEGKDERGKKVSSGIYFYRLEAGSYSQTKKMIMVK